MSQNMKWLAELPEGWSELYRSLTEELEKLDPDVEVSQAKQKFGELRVYLEKGSGEAYDLLDAATRESRTTCEQCGAAAKLRNIRGYYTTLCDVHADGTGPTDDEPILASFRILGGKIYPRKR